MPLNVQKVPSADDRSLPIFAEFDRIADRIELGAYNSFARRGAGEDHALDDSLAAERESCWPAAKLIEREGAFVLEGAKLRWPEFRSNNVLRRVELPSAVDVNKVSAKLKNGLLTIVAPLMEGAPAAATKIPVASGS